MPGLVGGLNSTADLVTRIMDKNYLTLGWIFVNFYLLIQARGPLFDRWVGDQRVRLMGKARISGKQ